MCCINCDVYLLKLKVFNGPSKVGLTCLKLISNLIYLTNIFIKSLNNCKNV